jgi:uncharacterized protein (DUF488 family)
VEHFMGLLRDAGVRRVIDVRTLQRSRTNPQFNAEVLPAALRSAGIGYEHIADLGGLRSRQREVPPEVNGFWQNASFHHHLGRDGPCALMCAEALWWHSHRRIISDYLLAAGDGVQHIMPDGTWVRARLTPAARRVGGGLAYPAVGESPASS